MSKSYLTVLRASETEFTEKRSRFIGRCFPVGSAEEAMEKLGEVRKRHYDATHNCWAYLLSSGEMRFSDDGEPGGTAGMPIMDTLIRRDVKDALIVVTRYFGGILLGSGGLVRAYSRSASDALKASGLGVMRPCSVLEFAVDYGRYGAIEAYVRSAAAEVGVDFAENVRLTVTVEAEKAGAFIAAITEKTDGRAVPAEVSTKYIAIPEGE